MRRDRSLIPLSHQHHNGLALCVLTDRGLASEDPGLLARRVIDRYELEIVNHFELEEQVLFPKLASAQPLVDTLVAEHRRITELVDGLRQSPSREALAEFTALLRRHIRTEENQLFEHAQQVLSREELDEIGAVFEARAVRVCL